ncbi:DUF2865 domain-containing protein [Bradyrhizobium sp. AUGA SZCCT0240]|uniref:DUF2865 domain-containing protein n=1 Tax=unclassified Bradyrhizobium TaxID=2631580 RepID=UPI001BA52D8B|nr:MULTISPECIES: DUF2865 domain-containing protein [unclassified Bradyrhizobium]MBR1193180.1 DUF2865 domain-containing protein [Bradyrhizobium sp. AUGA SZCCT0160]MBR1195765.1 DUF2865 domain-containing protein [Bradyrhizobium sp. AUGA SZCCT0158]MBR1240164.1 DUF2865 domain-containing protein [Bradyrhizobium sp. AUGA SZCCT0274]MBR1256265.1 DUF2865 domain-containing protein [Bradyrhizobium sp. AUGA SZCCT0240]
MPLTLTAPFSRWILTCAVLLAGIAGTSSAAIAQADPAPSNMDALAQMPPGAAPPPQQQGAQANPICIRLEGQLAAVDRGASGGDPAKEEQIRRYQEAATKQQAELDRVTMQAKRMGCESSGFFSLFNGQSAQCGPVNNQIQQMRANLEQMTTSLERLRSGGIGGADRENQRRSVLTALAQNNCGPQYAAAARNGGSFIDNLFGNNTIPPPSADLGAPSGTFRTVCVRTCDGAYFPVSFATYQARFQDDERTCKALCPATEASLFTYRNPGEDINQAVSVSGQPYSSLPNAFKFRTEFNPSCACKAAGQTWSDALKSIDEKAAAEQQGDIIVTEESAKRMQQRAMPQQKTAPVAKKGTAPAGTTAAAPAPATPAPAADSTGATDEKKQIRTVGPTFIPPKQ